MRNDQTLSKWPPWKRVTPSNVDRWAEEPGLSHIVGRHFYRSFVDVHHGLAVPQPRYFPKKNKNVCPQKMYTHHRSFIHNRQKLKIILMSVKRRTDKQSVGRSIQWLALGIYSNRHGTYHEWILHIVVLRERSLQETAPRMIPLIWSPRTGKNNLWWK